MFTLVQYIYKSVEMTGAPYWRPSTRGNLQVTEHLVQWRNEPPWTWSSGTVPPLASYLQVMTIRIYIGELVETSFVSALAG